MQTEENFVINHDHGGRRTILVKHHSVSSRVPRAVVIKIVSSIGNGGQTSFQYRSHSTFD